MKTIELDYSFEPTPRYGYGKPNHPILDRILGRHRGDYVSFLNHLGTLAEDFAKIPVSPADAGDTEPYWSNEWLPGLDAMALYGFLVQNNPQHYIEVGSGNSTKFARRAIRDHQLRTTITSIDPMPRAEIDTLCDEVIRAGMENVDQQIFQQLGPGDILFIDNSHRAFTNSDVTVFFLEVLPALRPGVMVHIHDIMLPLDYPPSWSERYYSEQYLLACYLIAEWPRLQIRMANAYVSTDSELIHDLMRVYSKAGIRDINYGGGSFWGQMR